MNKFVIDVSSHQKGIDTIKLAAQCDGVILRIGRTYYGSQVEDDDDCFDEWYESLKAIGKPVGCYYYSCADNSKEVKEETDLLLELLVGKSFELGIWMDEEDSTNQRPLSTAELTDVTKLWLDTIYNAGYTNVGLYASYFWLRDEVHANELPYPFWIARYNKVLGDTGAWDVAMWQYSSEGRIDGWSGDLDFNHCYMDIPESAAVVIPAVEAKVQTSDKRKPSEFTKSVQINLNWLGFTDENGKPLKVDGYNGPCTKGAIKKFQKAFGLVEDGVVGVKTRPMLDRVIAIAKKRPYVSISSKSDMVTVRYIQYIVGAKTDGVFGPLTEKAVKVYQGKHGLKKDGIVFTKTWKVILG